MNAPAIIYTSANTLWHDCANGDLLIDPLNGEPPLHLVRDHDGTFHFGHDDLYDCAKDGALRSVKRDQFGSFTHFKIGAVYFRVADHIISSDVYRCKPEHRK